MSFPSATATTRKTSSLGPRAATVVAVLLGVVVGSFLANSVPHLVQGLSGNVFMTPFGADSSPAVNLVWGGANLALALGLAVAVRARARRPAFVVGALLGAVSTAAILLVIP